MNNQHKEKGFTIIEVVLVLAIAGLIFLMVFIALPALQRNQRDTARKNEVSKVLSAITTYQSNNRGAAPLANETFGKYLDATKFDPITLESGTTVTASTGSVSGTVKLNASTDNIIYHVGAKCGAAENEIVAGSGRQAAAVIKLENGNAFFCQTS